MDASATSAQLYSGISVAYPNVNPAVDFAIAAPLDSATQVNQIAPSTIFNGSAPKVRDRRSAAAARGQRSAAVKRFSEYISKFGTDSTVASTTPQNQVHDIASPIISKSPKPKRQRTKTQKTITVLKNVDLVAKATQKRFCLYCGDTETKQWRSGPEGVGTLCNADGLRYAKMCKKGAKIVDGDVEFNAAAVAVANTFFKNGPYKKEHSHSQEIKTPEKEVPSLPPLEIIEKEIIPEKEVPPPNSMIVANEISLKKSENKSYNSIQIEEEQEDEW